MRRSVILAVLFFCALMGRATGRDSLNVVILGDSNSWIGGEDSSKPEGWNHWFKEEFQPATCQCLARSGATWTNTPKTRRNIAEYTELLGNDNVIYNQVCRLEEAVSRGTQPCPQLILMMAGTNDAWFLKQRRQALALTARQAYRQPLQALLARKPSAVVTLAESVRYNCERLRRCFPEARLVLITPPQSVHAEAHLKEVCDLIDACGREAGIPVIRLDRDSGISSAAERRGKHYTTDGTHTSVEGARRCGHLVAQTLERLLNETE